MSQSISLFHPRLFHLDRTEQPHSLGAPLIDGGIYVGTNNKEYLKKRLQVGIDESGIWVEREDGVDLQVIVAPRLESSGQLDKPVPTELLATPLHRLVLGRSAMQGYMTIPEDVMRPDGLEDLREFADILASRVIDQQCRLQQV